MFVPVSPSQRSGRTGKPPDRPRHSPATSRPDRASPSLQPLSPTNRPGSDPQSRTGVGRDGGSLSPWCKGSGGFQRTSGVVRTPVFVGGRRSSPGTVPVLFSRGSPSPPVCVCRSYLECETDPEGAQGGIWCLPPLDASENTGTPLLPCPRLRRGCQCPDCHRGLRDTEGDTGGRAVRQGVRLVVFHTVQVGRSSGAGPGTVRARSCPCSRHLL